MSQKKEDFLAKIKEMSFEQAMTELEIVVKKLETGKENLDNAVDAYEYGNALREFCEKKLKEAELRVEKIIKNANGSLSSTSISTEENV